jgi:hypothetical protein
MPVITARTRIHSAMPSRIAMSEWLAQRRCGCVIAGHHDEAVEHGRRQQDTMKPTAAETEKAMPVRSQA